MNLTNALLAAAASGIVMGAAGCGGEAKPAMAPAAGGGTIQCKEANSCKGNATCTGIAAGEKHGCKAQNKCTGNVRELSKADCDGIKGTVVAEK